MEHFSNWGCNNAPPIAAPTLAPTFAPTTPPPTTPPPTTPPPTTPPPTTPPPTTPPPTTPPPTTPPPTVPPTFAPTTPPPTFAPTFAPATPPPTFAPTNAPIAIPTLYLRYDSDCSTPDFSAVSGVNNFVSVAMVTAIGGYEPSESANNYIYEPAYGGPYIPNVRDPQNLPAQVPTQAPDVQGDPYLMLKYEFYKNTQRYNDFLIATRKVIDELGGDVTLGIQNAKSKTPQVISSFGEGYIVVQFFKSSTINYDKTAYFNQSDSNFTFSFKLFETIKTTPQVILCKDCISGNDGIRQFCKYSTQTTCFPVVDDAQIYKLQDNTSIFSFLNTRIQNSNSGNVFYSFNGFFVSSTPSLVPYVAGDGAYIIALFSNSTYEQTLQFETELINNIYSSTTANYVVKFNLNYLMILYGSATRFNETDYIFMVLVSEPTDTVIINAPVNNSVTMWVRVDQSSAANPVSPFTPNLCLSPAPVGANTLRNRECAISGNAYTPNSILDSYLSTDKQKADYLNQNGNNALYGVGMSSDASCNQACQSTTDCVAYTYTVRTDKSTPIDCVNDNENKKFCIYDSNNKPIGEQGYCILYGNCDYTVSTRLANTTSNTSWKSGTITTVSPSIPPNTPPFFNRLLGCKSWLKNWGPDPDYQNPAISTQQTSDDCQRFCSNAMDGNLPDKDGIANPFGFLPTDHDDKIYATCNWNPQDKSCKAMTYRDKALDYCKDPTKVDASCIPFQMRQGSQEGCIMDSSCFQLGDVSGGTSIYMNSTNKEIMSLEFSYTYQQTTTIVTCDNFNIKYDGTVVSFNFGSGSVSTTISGTQIVKFIYMFDGGYSGETTTDSSLYIVNNGKSVRNKVQNLTINKFSAVTFVQAVGSLNVCGISPQPPSMCNTEILYDDSLTDSSWYSWDSTPLFGLNLTFVPNTNHKAGDLIVDCGNSWTMNYFDNWNTIQFTIGQTSLQLSGFQLGSIYNVSIYISFDSGLILFYAEYSNKNTTTLNGKTWLQTYKSTSITNNKSSWNQQITFGVELQTLNICGGTRAQAPTAAPTAAPTEAPTAKPIAFITQNVVGCYTEDCKYNSVNYPIDYYDYGKYSSSSIIPNVAQLLSPSKTNINMGMQKNGDVYGAYGFKNILNNWQTQLYLTRKTNDPRSICNNVCWDASYRANRGKCLTNSNDAFTLYNMEHKTGTPVLGILSSMNLNYNKHINSVPDSYYWKNPTKPGAGPNGATLYDVMYNDYNTLSSSCANCFSTYEICSYNNCGSNRPGGLTEGECRARYCAPTLASCIGLSTVDTINLGGRVKDTGSYNLPLDFNFKYYDSSKTQWVNTEIKTNNPETYINKDGTINFRADSTTNNIDLSCLCVSSSDESISIKTTPISGTTLRVASVEDRTTLRVASVEDRTPTYSVSDVGNVCMTKSGTFFDYIKVNSNNTECKNLCNTPPADFQDIGFGCTGYTLSEDNSCLLNSRPITDLKYYGGNIITCNAKTEIPGMDSRYSTVKISPSTTPQSTCCSPNSIGWESLGTSNGAANITVYDQDTKEKCNKYCATHGYNIASFSPKSTEPLNGYVDPLNICSCFNSGLWNSSNETTFPWGPSQGHTYDSFTSTAVSGNYFNQQQNNTECISFDTESITAMTLEDCQTQCKNRTDKQCTAISYNQTTKECKIHYSNVYTMKQSTDWRCSVRQINNNGQITFAPTLAPTFAPTTPAPTTPPPTTPPPTTPPPTTPPPTTPPPTTPPPTTPPPTMAPTIAPNTEGCTIGGINWCAEGGFTMLANRKATATFGNNAGIHNDCWQNLGTANAGVIGGANVGLTYNSSTKRYQIINNGCGSGPYRLCAMDTPNNVFGSNVYTEWLRQDQPQTAQMSCDWVITNTANGLTISVPSDSPATTQRGLLLGTNTSTMPYWNDQSGKPNYGLLTNNSTQSDETLWDIRSLTTKIYLATIAYSPQYTVGSMPKIVGSTLQFIGSNWLNYPNTTFDMSKGFSFIMYFRFTSSMGWQSPMDFANGAGNNNILFTQNGNVANTFRFSIYNGTTENACDGGTTTVGAYQKFIGVYDPTAKTITTYIDNVKVGSITLSSAITDTRTLANCYVGTSNWTTLNTYANMDLQSLSVYNRTLQPTEVGAAMINLATTGYYPQYTVGSAPTISGSIMKFTANGNVSGNYLNYANTTFDMSKGFSFVAYFRFTSSAGWQRVFDFANGSPNNNILFTQSGDVANTFRFSVYNGTTEYACDGGTITYGTFQKFTGVYDPTAKTITTYVNNVKVGSITLPSAITDTRTLANCYVARSNWAGDPYANMDLGYLLVYNRVLTENEIVAPCPSIYLSMSKYYPPYTIGSAPTNNGATLQFRNGNWLNYPSSTFNMSKGFSFVAYFRFISSAGWQRVFDFANGSPNNNILFTQSGDVANTFRFSVWNGTTEYACNGGTITYGTYQKFVGIYDPNAKTITTYLNDVKVGSLTLASAITDTRTLSNCYIGRSNWSSDPYANMDLDSLTIYNQVINYLQ